MWPGWQARSFLRECCVHLSRSASRCIVIDTLESMFYRALNPNSMVTIIAEGQ